MTRVSEELAAGGAIEPNALAEAVNEEAETTERSHRLLHFAGRAALVCGGAAAGVYFAVNGAHYSTEVADMRVKVSTEVGAHRTTVDIGATVEDGAVPSTDLGKLRFSDIDGLPVGVHVQVYPGPSAVNEAIKERFAYAAAAKKDAREKVAKAEKYFAERAVAGLLGGAAVGAIAGEVAVGLYRRRRDGSAHISVPWALGRTVAAIAATGGLAAGYGATTYDSNWASNYTPSGLAADALHSPRGLEKLADKNTALASILTEFQAAHACPASKEQDVDDRPPDALTLTTYNIKRGAQQGIDEVIKQLAATKSDVITLQEVTPETLAALAKELHMEGTPGWTIQSDVLTYGDAILTKLPVITSQSYSLLADGQEPRELLTVNLQAPDGQAFWVATTHLTNESLTMHGDRNSKIRDEQAKRIMRIFQNPPFQDRDLVFTGDMNAGIKSGTYDTFTSSLADMLKPTDLAKTITSPADGQAFDHIFGSKEWATVTAGVGGGDASDHCSLTTVLLSKTTSFAKSGKLPKEISTPQEAMLRGSNRSSITKTV